jgi:outer membrane protein assembly factor BamB
MNKKGITLIAPALIIIFSVISFASDWPCWRGPNGNGISKETNWNPGALAGGAKILWKINVGNGHSAVAIKGNYLYTMGNKAVTSGDKTTNEDTVYCLDKRSGKTIWRYSYPCKEGQWPGPHATPVINDDNVYTFSKEGELFCFDANKGIVKWKKNVVAEFKAEKQTWGFSSSPLIENGVLLINACTNGIALNAKTGAKIWASKPGIAGYAVPKIYEMNGKKCIVISGQKAIFGVDFISCIDIKTGEVVWTQKIGFASIMAAGGKLIILSERGELIIAEAVSQGYKELSRAHLPETSERRIYWTAPILLDGCIYCRNNSGDLFCVDMRI